MLMSADAYRASLRRLKPTVYVDGERVNNVADDPRLAPGVAAIAKTLVIPSQWQAISPARNAAIPRAARDDGTGARADEMRSQGGGVTSLGNSP